MLLLAEMCRPDWLLIVLAFVIGFGAGWIGNQYRRAYHPQDKYDDDQQGR